MKNRNVVELTATQIKDTFPRSRLRVADLFRGTEGFTLALQTEHESVPVLAGDAGDRKTWKNVGTAVAFVREHFTSVMTINIHQNGARKQ